MTGFSRLATGYRLLLAAAVLLALLPLNALAGAGATPSQEPAEAAQEDHAPQEDHAAEEEHAESESWWPPWLETPARWINFFLLVALLYWVLVKPPAAVRDLFTFSGLGVILGQRGAEILEARDLAARQKSEAANLLTASEERLLKIEGEIAALVENAQQSAVTDRRHVAEEGERQAAKVLEVARREVENEKVAAQRQLRGFVADLAVGLARGNLEKHLTAEDQARLINDYLARLGRSMA